MSEVDLTSKVRLALRMILRSAASAAEAAVSACVSDTCWNSAFGAAQAVFATLSVSLTELRVVATPSAAGFASESAPAGAFRPLSHPANAINKTSKSPMGDFMIALQRVIETTLLERARNPDLQSRWENFTAQTLKRALHEK